MLRSIAPRNLELRARKSGLVKFLRPAESKFRLRGRVPVVISDSEVGYFPTSEIIMKQQPPSSEV